MAAYGQSPEQLLALQAAHGASNEGWAPRRTPCHRALPHVLPQRFLFMKLTYHDHTPMDYEPPLFVPVDDNGIGHFK